MRSRFCSRWFMALAVAGLLAAPSQAQSPLDPGAQFFWGFDEGSGDVVAEENFGYESSLGFAVDEAAIPAVITDSPSGADGDNAVDINDGLFAEDPDAVLDIVEGPITMEAWIRVESLNTFNGILSYGGSYKLGINNGNLIFTFFGIVDIDSGVAIEPDNTWRHVAVAWEPGLGVAFFVDGVEVNFVGEEGAPQAIQNNRLDIGTETNGAVPLNGQIDRVRVHKAILTADQLDSDPASPSEPLENTLAAYNFDADDFPFENLAGTSVTSAEATALAEAEGTQPEFTEDTPTGDEGDYSLFFEAGDVTEFVDQNLDLQFIDEDFTLETWVKFDLDDQVSGRPVVISSGIGGQSGYSFSFLAQEATELVEDSPTGEPGDLASSGPLLGEDPEAAFDITPGPITMEAWAKSDSFGNTWTDFGRYGDTYKLGINPDGNLVFTFLGVVDINTEVPFPFDGEWHHVAAAWEPGVGVTFYIDGEEATFVENTDAPVAPANNFLAIGAANNGSSAFDGNIDRFRIHNAVLGPDELDADAASPADALDTTVAAYTFDDGLPSANLAAPDVPVDSTFPGISVAMTTYGILDVFSDAVIPNDGQWHHIAGVHVMGSEMRFFVDGELQDTVEYDGGVLLAETPRFLFGRSTGTEGLYVGYLDRVRMTRAALDAESLDYFEPVSVDNWSLY